MESPAHPPPDRLGLRTADAGALALDHVTVAPDQILGLRPHDEESSPLFTGLAGPALRLALSHVGLGIIDGALTEPRDHSRSSKAARLHSTDPDLVLAYGELTSAAQAAALMEQASNATAHALEAEPDLDAEVAAAATFLVAAAETIMAKAALYVTAKIFEFADAQGLDRFWRNARVLTADHATAHRLRSMCDHYLKRQDLVGLRAPRLSPVGPTAVEAPPGTRRACP